MSDIIPGGLSSTTLRKRLEEAKDPAVLAVAPAIDYMRSQFESLRTLHKSRSPDMTKEAHATRYRQQYEQARARARASVTELADRLSATKREAEAKARQATGIDEPLPHAEASEIRTALRGMKPDERNKAISTALEKGDTAVVRAVVHSPSEVVYGGTTVPVESRIDMMLEAKHPELAAIREQTKEAAQALFRAHETFEKGAEEMRDPFAEEKAEQQRAAIAAAEAMLQQQPQSEGEAA